MQLGGYKMVHQRIQAMHPSDTTVVNSLAMSSTSVVIEDGHPVLLTLWFVIYFCGVIYKQKIWTQPHNQQPQNIGNLQNAMITAPGSRNDSFSI